MKFKPGDLVQRTDENSPEYYKSLGYEKPPIHVYMIKMIINSEVYSITDMNNHLISLVNERYLIPFNFTNLFNKMEGDENKR